MLLGWYASTKSFTVKQDARVEPSRQLQSVVSLQSWSTVLVI